MRKLVCSFLFVVACCTALGQSPCKTDVLYRQFDFWIGDWDVYGIKGKLAGTSKISAILDDCVILEEWTSSGSQNGLTFTGKSFNTYNAATKQWQQTWVDNTGGTTEFLNGKFSDNQMQFMSRPFPFSGDTMAIRRLTFFHLNENTVRQFGELSKDEGKTWAVEYDLEYRRRLIKQD